MPDELSTFQSGLIIFLACYAFIGGMYVGWTLKSRQKVVSKGNILPPVPARYDFPEFRNPPPPPPTKALSENPVYVLNKKPSGNLSSSTEFDKEYEQIRKGLKKKK